MRQEPVVADAIKAVAEVISHLENLVNLQRFPFLFDGVGGDVKYHGFMTGGKRK
jgi:hypothetical protein